MSVVLPDDLRRQVEREAAARGLGLSPAVRVLVAERLRDLAEEAELTRAERWQRAQAWASWEDPENAVVGWDEVDAAFDAPAPRARRRS
ncbi:MAG: hypothetical protein M3Y87_33200 [Myxococcota bacterium]|nr:hypothetical protein [Myxococcota bacterium]